MNEAIVLSVLAAAAVAALAPRAKRRLELSLAKHPSLTGHVRMAKRVASLVPALDYDEGRFFGADDPPPHVRARRRAGFEQLATDLAAAAPRSIQATREARDAISDMQFTAAYRVPFPFSAYLRRHITVGAFVEAARGVQLIDLDGNAYDDLTGSYGVNVFGVDFYKDCIARGSARVAELGPVLGSYHPCVGDNARRLQRISGLDEVSFHMSGTEAVMQAVRLARYHTKRSHLVRFSGAYHGWWEDVQPGPGNPQPPRATTYTLREMDARTLKVLRTRRDIACVLVNPLQALHPNRGAPGDSSLVDGSRSAGYDREAYTQWLRELREVCSARGIVLIFDEVFVGFRLAPGGAQEYFGVRADLVCYGKTIAGGLPIGVVCGLAELMKRYTPERPADICFARGTFNAHPYVMGAMSAFLDRLDEPATRALYNQLDETWDARREQFNARMQSEGLPVRAANLSTIWTITYAQPSRYHWMLQFYLRRAGLALSWVGTGRLIFNLAYTPADFERVLDSFVRAARAMREDGWWWHDGTLDHRTIRRGVLRELLARRFGRGA